MAPCSEPTPLEEAHLAWPWRPLAPASSSGWRTLAAIRFRNCSSCVAARGHNLARGGPLRDLLPIDRGGHQFRKQIGSAGEGRNSEPCEGRCDVMIVTRRAVVVEREQSDELDSCVDQRRR